MKRAFVGFSSPIGYIYSKDGDHRGDLNEKPDAILYGSTGLLTLYDELWFPSKMTCPRSMQGLSYVKFLDVDSDPSGTASSFAEDVEEVHSLLKGDAKYDLSFVFDGDYSSGMRSYLGNAWVFDNHSRGTRFLGQDVLIMSNPRTLIIDAWIIQQWANLNLDLCLNPLTAKTSFPLLNGDLLQQSADNLRRVQVAENVLTLGSTYDLLGADGPYHPVIEEIRDDELLKAFRKWLSTETSRLDNREMRDIRDDVDNKIKELTEKSVRKYVAPNSLRNVGVDLVKSSVLGLVPGANYICKAIDLIKSRSKAKDRQWQAFIALSRSKLQRR